VGDTGGSVLQEGVSYYCHLLLPPECMVQVKLWVFIYLTNDHSLWLPFLSGSDPLTSGVPVNILLISSLLL